MKFINLFAIILLISSCYSSSSYDLLKRNELRQMEREDHQTCLSYGLDSQDWNSTINQIYWQCRLKQIEAREISNPIKPDELMFNNKIRKISKVIIIKIEEAREINLAKIDQDIETNDHNNCLAQGFSNKFDPTAKDNMEKYYQCRQDLVLERNVVAPKLSNIYEDVIMGEDGLYYLGHGNQKSRKVQLKEEAMKVNQQIAQYPKCDQFQSASLKFRQCAHAHNDANQCNSKIPEQISKRRLSDKIYCYKQSFIQFPASMASSGKFIDDEPIFEPDEEDNQTIKFSKIELLTLREDFVGNCNHTKDLQITDYAKELQKECNKIALNWEERTKNPTRLITEKPTKKKLSKKVAERLERNKKKLMEQEQKKLLKKTSELEMDDLETEKTNEPEKKVESPQSEEEPKTKKKREERSMLGRGVSKITDMLQKDDSAAEVSSDVPQDPQPVQRKRPRNMNALPSF